MGPEAARASASSWVTRRVGRVRAWVKTKRRRRSRRSASRRLNGSSSRRARGSARSVRINATRARTYRTAQLITAIVAFFVGLMVLTNRDYMEPFGTVAGQIVLALVTALVAVSVWGMVVLSRPVRAPRLLRVGDVAHREAVR